MWTEGISTGGIKTDDTKECALAHPLTYLSRLL